MNYLIIVCWLHWRRTVFFTAQHAYKSYKYYKLWGTQSHWRPRASTPSPESPPMLATESSIKPDFQPAIRNACRFTVHVYSVNLCCHLPNHSRNARINSPKYVPLWVWCWVWVSIFFGSTLCVGMSGFCACRISRPAQNLGSCAELRKIYQMAQKMLKFCWFLLTLSIKTVKITQYMTR